MSRIGRAVAVGFVIFAPICARAQTHRIHVVQAVFVDGKAVPSAPATLARGANVARSVYRGENIADGTRVDVPAHVVLVVVNVPKSKVILEPGSSITFVNTGAGELVKSNGGLAIFSVVPKALDFYRVQSSEVLTASVHGTEFSVNAAAGTVTFTCRLGEISIIKTGYLLIGDQRTKTSLIDVISADNRAKATYRPSLNWSLAKFENFAQAEEFYLRQLRGAQHRADVNAINVALLNLGNVQRSQGRYADAFKSFSQALSYYRKESDRDREAQAWEGLGLVRLDEDRYADALGYFQNALEGFQSVGDIAGQADSFKDVGNVALNRNQYGEARSAQQKAYELYGSLGDADGQARTWLDLGLIADAQGRHDAALVYFQKSLRILERLGDLDGAGFARQSLGLAYASLARYTQAREQLSLAVDAYRRLGDPTRQAYALLDLGMIEEKQGRYEAAQAYVERSRALLQSIGNKGADSSPLMELGVIEERQHKYDDALDHLETALNYFKANREAGMQAETMRNIGVVQMDRRQYDAAQQSLQGALDIFNSLKDREGIDRVMRELARLRELKGGATPPP